jgi:hypothetical protein
MGCCESVAQAPVEIIPDPAEDETCTFSIGRVGMLSSDYVAYQGPDNSIEERKWFFINKTGSIFGGVCEIHLENFIRGKIPDAPEKGEVLWKATFDSTPRFERHYKSPQSNDFFGWSSGFGDVDGEDFDDDYYFDGFSSMKSTRRIMKWKMTTTALISPGTRGEKYNNEKFQIEVFARGTAIAFYEQEINEQGEIRWDKDTRESVDKICVRILRGGKPLVAWGVEGERANSDFSLANDIFKMRLNGGWVSINPIIDTSPDWDPTLALIIAYMCAYEFSPSEIKNDFKPNFPSDPYAWGGGW